MKATFETTDENEKTKYGKEILFKGTAQPTV